MNEAEYFERIIVDELCRIAKEKQFNHSQLAKAAFGDVSGSITRWRQFRHPRKNTGKPQSLTIADTYRLCRALDIEPGTLIYRASERFKIEFRRK